MQRATDFGFLAVGSEPRFEASFAVDGVATDPTEVTFTWRIGSGSPTEWIYGTDEEIVKDETGEYHVVLPVTDAGTWYGRWVGTGAAAAASELTFGAWTNFPAEPEE
jgi:hypothetical protein